jgi:tRNA (cmo5U34)-methyltransferase
MDEVRRAFDAGAARYDAQRRLVIPDFDDFYGAALWAAVWMGSSPNILDIGAGTGLFSAMVLKRYPKSTITLLDISDNMLDVARHRFRGRSNVRFHVGDYSQENLEGRYDIVVSALSIHHLSHTDKKDLYQRIFDALNRGGVFVNAEQVRGESAWTHRRNLEYWDTYIGQGSLSEEEAEQVRLRRDHFDHMEKLSEQVRWLEEIGYRDADIVYKNRSFAVFSGRKASE